MPELPEVHTTVEGLNKTVIQKTIADVWSDFHIGTAHGERDNIKNKKYYEKFRKTARGAKIVSAKRRGKNILINLNNGNTIVVHMKMTGHLMVGKYKKSKTGDWKPVEDGPLQDPYNKYIHLVFSFSDGSHLVLSDMRKFASVTISKTDGIGEHERVGKLGPEPLEIKKEEFIKIIDSKRGCPIKPALMDQTAISGIGNIYSDEILWQTGVHPLSCSDKITPGKLGRMFEAMQSILRFSIKHGGDSKSDYRNIFGERGGFQNFHKAYGKKGQKCPKPKCSGIIERMTVRGRSAHFCTKHQIIYK